MFPNILLYLCIEYAVQSINNLLIIYIYIIIIHTQNRKLISNRRYLASLLKLDNPMMMVYIRTCRELNASYITPIGKLSQIDAIS